ncbi:hypothetical protein CHOED_016 [Vibrio phage CHOED]|uniref:hypothetical protein n=1 Tax=Vibrio phage CHOED TaxID=1458716 RepID=UPI00042ED92A|nr:hypothetical protein CHOED_016 [Vibrio phage CHOED]AHK11876.1 hypothetical protein CHOED_016 [Vibrio phage CHOED]
MSFGEALATGLAQGLGEGVQDYYKDQRREKMEVRQLDRSFDMFKKQSQYSFALEGIGKQNEALGAWEDAAKLDTKTLAFQAATKMSAQFSKEDRPKFLRDSMKNLNGMSKAELLSRAGYNKPDYSQWIDNPEYQDAIPMSRVAGMGELPDASSVFKYDPRQFEEQHKVEGEKVTDYMRKKDDEFSAISSMSVINFGAKTSTELNNLIWKNRPSGVGVVMKGADAISYDKNLLDTLINTGQVVQVGPELKLVGELSDVERATFAPQAPAAPQSTSGSPGALYTEPKTEEYLTNQEEKEALKVQRTESKAVEKNQGKTIKSYTSLDDLQSQLESLSPEAQKILFGDTSLKGMLAMTDVGKQLAAKADVAGAQEARKFLALMENISATLKHEQYGSAQTATELKNFADQLGNPSILQNPKTLLDQIRTRKQLVGSSLSAAVGTTGREAYLKEHPDMAAMLNEVWSSGDSNQTVSDSAAPLPTKADLMASGKYTEAQVDAYLAAMSKQ